MSAIAYITDSKLLEMHRLNQNKEMNNASQNADKEIQKTADELIKS